MTFWIIAVTVVAVAAIVIVLPLIRREEDAAPRAAHDVQVVRDQLRAVDRDVERGVIAETEADVSLIFVPPAFAPDAVVEAADAGVRLVVCVTEGIPVYRLRLGAEPGPVAFRKNASFPLQAEDMISLGDLPIASTWVSISTSASSYSPS